MRKIPAKTCGGVNRIGKGRWETHAAWRTVSFLLKLSAQRAWRSGASKRGVRGYECVCRRGTVAETLRPSICTPVDGGEDIRFALTLSELSGGMR